MIKAPPKRTGLMAEVILTALMKGKSWGSQSGEGGAQGGNRGFLQESDEGDAEEGTKGKTGAADDQHREHLDGQVQLKHLQGEAVAFVSEETASDAGVNGTEEEGAKFVGEDIDAEELGRQVVIADGDEGAPGAGCG